MGISVFDFFRIGVGPSSSHTVGPMRAANRFVQSLAADGLLAEVERVRVELFGSLGATGQGHGTGPAVLAGLTGAEPDTVPPEFLPEIAERTERERVLPLAGGRTIAFDPAPDLVFYARRSLPEHPNGVRFTAMASDGTILLSRDEYSVGGGFLLSDAAEGGAEPPCPFTTAAELLAWSRARHVPISTIALANEAAYRSEAATRDGLLHIRTVMAECVEHGLHTEGTLPGPMAVTRRAPGLYQRLTTHGAIDPLSVMDWLGAYAIAVNEENAAGSRVVTAPTNGAAGIVPAVLHYYRHHTKAPTEDGVVRYLLTAGAMALIIKQGASLSGAEAGCQGEVGSACAMAAAGLTEVCGGTPEQVENAAEIALEHHLGMTCDPVGGRVQIPCIERNAVGSVKAVNASRMALNGDGGHRVSLDQVIRTLRDTGRDMKKKYKETSLGGLAVNVIEC